MMSALAKSETTSVVENKVKVGGTPDTELQQYLTFLLGGDIFAIGILVIKEILEYEELTEVPMTPESIRGVINLRGSVVPVIDLSARFGGKRTTITRRACIVILEVNSGEGNHDIGVVVDSVSEVLEIPPSEIEPAPSFGAKIRTDFIAGMGKVDGKFVILLDIDHVLSVNDLTQLESVAQQASESEQEKVTETLSG
jgi:purine-binding chemotaxis protein CheW